VHDEQTVNRIRKIAWASIFHLMSPCLRVHASMSSCACLRVHVSMSPFFHVSMSRCIHVSVSMFPRLHLHGSVSHCLHVYVHVYVSMFPKFRKRKTELMGNGNIHLFAADGKRKRQISVCLLQTETEKGRVSSIVGKRQTIIDDSCLSKCAPLGQFVTSGLKCLSFLWSVVLYSPLFTTTWAQGRLQRYRVFKINGRP
jgi:hypothetical protein